MTTTQVLQWIKTNLGPIIKHALAENTDVIYTEDWLAGMVYRETGILLHRYIRPGITFQTISELMKGDYGQRPADKEKRYHGYSYWQIDIGSYPDFIKSGDWKDPFKSCMKAIHVLEEKRSYLFGNNKHLDAGNYSLDNIHRAITAAYNCGQGNVEKALESGKDVDTYTYNHDYSKEVWRFREQYRNLQ